MPEEINRLLTDQMADLLFTPSQDGDENLKREGIAEDKIHLVGNVMIDTLVRLLPQAHDEGLLDSLFTARSYALVTMHRPSNVDEPAMLKKIMEALDEISHSILVIFPIHPRTRQRLQGLGVRFNISRLKLIEPIGYLQFLTLQRQARLVITDSGGIQEETTFLGIPCLTVRENTERPVTTTIGTNVLVGQNMSRLKEEVDRIIGGAGRQGSVPPLWDGRASERIAAIVQNWLAQKPQDLMAG